MLFTYSMLPEIKTPARYGEHGTTLIDNIFINKLSRSSFSGLILNDLSDHLPIFYVTGNYTVKQKKSNVYKQMRQVNDDRLLSCLRNLESVTGRNVIILILMLRLTH